MIAGGLVEEIEGLKRKCPCLVGRATLEVEARPLNRERGEIVALIQLVKDLLCRLEVRLGIDSVALVEEARRAYLPREVEPILGALERAMALRAYLVAVCAGPWIECNRPSDQ